MESLKEKHQKKIANTSTKFIRSMMDVIDWNNRLVSIKGARGIGKTTLLLQYIKKHYGNDPTALYVSMDDIYFSDNKLIHFADTFAKQGGQHLFLDEVHKYANWSQEIKNIYDDLPELKVVFTGSSLLEIINARADLSRRAISYKMQGLSFREYLQLTLGKALPLLTLETIFSDTSEITNVILQSVKPLQYFSTYLQEGYYPFILEGVHLYQMRISEIINMIIELELPLLRNVDVSYTVRLKQLLLIIAQSAPFIPNISKLSERIGINRNTLHTYINYLQEAGITHNLYKNAHGISKLQKPEKIFLENTNLAYTFNTPNIGNVRETFFANQLSYKHTLQFPKQGDFLVDDYYLVEIGRTNKRGKQIKDISNSYIASDGIEYGFGNTIPLWMFGFLY